MLSLLMKVRDFLLYNTKEQSLLARKEYGKNLSTEVQDFSILAKRKYNQSTKQKSKVFTKNSDKK